MTSAHAIFRKVAAGGVRRIILRPASATVSVVRSKGHHRPLASRLRLAALFFVLVVSYAAALTSLLAAVMYTPRIVDSALHSRAMRSFLELGTRPLGRPQSHTTLVCTVGAGIALRRAYPLDGVCNYIVFTHALYDEGARSLRARGGQSWSWQFFLRQASVMTATRLLPSFDWATLVGALDRGLSLRLNASLVREGMHGLALFEVAIQPEQLPRIAAAMNLMAEWNPGMFLALGVSFRGLHDDNALQLLPPGVLDRAVTPLSMLVLETHMPPLFDGECRTVLTSTPEPRAQDPEELQQLTLKGATRILAEHQDLRHVVGSELVGCFSLFVGALVFNTSGQDKQLGASCTSWSREKVNKVCKHPSVRVDEHAGVAYGQDGDRFFSFEVVQAVADKVAPLLNATLLRDRTPCMALYNLELEDGSSFWSRPPERYVKMVDEAHALLRKRLLPAGLSSPGDSGLWGSLFSP